MKVGFLTYDVAVGLFELFFYVALDVDHSNRFQRHDVNGGKW